MFDDIGVGITLTLKNMDKIDAEIDALRTKLNSMKNTKISLSGMSKDAKTTDHTFKNILSNVKKFGFALLTVRGIWFGIRKAMTTYLAQNEELQSKLNAVYYALGSMFAPILEVLINALVWIISLLDSMLKMIGLAGINMSKFGKATGKAAKEMKSLAGFDEINNLNSQQQSGGGSSVANPFKDIEITPFQTALGWVILSLLTIIGLFSILRKFMPFADAAKYAIGLGIAVAGLVIAIDGIVKYLNDPSWKNFSQILIGIGILIVGLGVAFFGLPVIIAGAVVAILGFVAMFWDEIKGWFDSAIEWFNNIIAKAYEISPILGFVAESVLGVFRDLLGAIKNFLDNGFKNLKGLLDGIIMLFKGDFKSGIELVLKSIANIFINLLNFVIDAVNTFLTPFRAIIVGVGSIIGKSWTMGDIRIPNVPLLATGTNYVPNDMLAYIHEGEAVVPKEFNPSAFYGNSTAEELNLLAQINQNLIDLNKKDVDITLDGESIANKINNSIQQINYRNGNRVFALGR